MSLINTDPLEEILLHIEERLAAAEKDIAALKPKTITWPYANWENCKYTFPDAHEVPALDIRKTDYRDPYIKFNDDGSIRFDLPADIPFTPTKTAKNPRIERREYKNMAAKSNYTKGDVIHRNFIVVFHKLNLGLSDVVWTQMHGVDDPYFKVVAGKKGIRVQCKTKEGLPSDDVVKELLPASSMAYEVPYHYQSTFDGTNLAISLDNVKHIISFDRADSFYPKEGAYGPLGVSLTHKPA